MSDELPTGDTPTPPVTPPPGEPVPSAPGGADWERDLLNRLAFATLVEQRRTRRWNLVFKFSILAYLIVVLVLYFPGSWIESRGGDRHTALVDVKGVISPDSEASADRIVAGLRAAFEDEDTAGVIVRINSPGGSPVQSSYIAREMARLRDKYPKVPLFAVITDIAASGGYYVAVGADKIYADEASMVGSIGVLLDGFGFVDAMERLGVERRLLTAGENKGLLDPFSPSRPEEVRHIKTLLDDVHRQFIDTVKKSRGDRLKDDGQLFTGLVWTGREGVNLGLVDALGSSSYVAREVIGAEDIVDFTPRRGVIDVVVDRLGVSIVRSFLDRVVTGPLTVQ